MKFVIRRNHWKVYTMVLSLVILVAAGVFVAIPKVQAAGGVGGGGTPGSSSGGTYNSDYSFGWRLYNATSSQPGELASMTEGSWSDVYNACKDVGQVWMFLIFNSNGTSGREYKFDIRNAPELLEPNYGDPSGRYYWSYFNNPKKLTNGSYYSQNYRGSASENTVHGHFNTAVRNGVVNPGNLQYGYDVGWFCWSDNPPWTITATTTVNSKVAEPGDTITWTHTVRNNGPNKTNRAVAWNYVNKGDWPVPDSTGGNWSLGSGTTSGNGDTKTSTYTTTIADFGKKICRLTTATPSSNVLTSGATSSGQACVTVAKKPKVQVLGGDLSVGRAFVNGTAKKNAMIVTSQSVTNATPKKTYGSWGEYGLLASGLIEGMGSGAALKDGRDNVPNICDYSKLSFSNATTVTACNNTAGTTGGYTSTGAIPDVSGAFKVVPSTQEFGSIDDAQYKRVEKATKTVNIPGGTLDPGEWLVINAEGYDVNITGDIKYTDATLKGIADIPQLIIIANNINIAGNVTQVDAWLVASGTSGVINTCSDVTAGARLTSVICTNALTVNGPVMAKKIYLQRTAKADAPSTIGEPAETFNLRADSHLWAMSRSLQGVHVNVAETTELPPRF